jgi:hypothetical protein
MSTEQDAIHSRRESARKPERGDDCDISFDRSRRVGHDLRPAPQKPLPLETEREIRDSGHALNEQEWSARTTRDPHGSTIEISSYAHQLAIGADRGRVPVSC